jgi:hypothetical protein
VELRISCANLQDKDVFSKSDPIVAVYQQPRGTSGWTEVSRLLRSVCAYLNYRKKVENQCKNFYKPSLELHVDIKRGCSYTSKVRNLPPTHFSFPFPIFLWLQLARTEWIQNSLNPQFSKVIEVDYRFEEVQKLKFMVYDIDNATSGLDDDDFLGCLQCTLGEVSTTCMLPTLPSAV